jgi:hypothetical protein
VRGERGQRDKRGELIERGEKCEKDGSDEIVEGERAVLDLLASSSEWSVFCVRGLSNLDVLGTCAKLCVGVVCATYMFGIATCEDIH